MRKQTIVKWVVLLGIFRTVGPVPVLLHLPVFALGLVQVLRGRISIYLYPALLLGITAILSCVANSTGFSNYIKALMLVGAVGVAGIVAGLDRDELAKTIAGPLLYLVLGALALETVMASAGLGGRERSLNAIFGLLGDINLPRYIGFRGGSAFSALALGVLGLICFAHGYRWRALLYLALIGMMMSRGPLVGVIVIIVYALLYFPILRLAFGTAVVVGVVATPLIIHISQQALPYYLQVMLIDISTMRYYSFTSFLQFGLDNPIFGVGYDNYKAYFVDYSRSYEGMVFGFFPEHRLHEAHNLMLDVWGELGITGYTFLAIHILLMWRMVATSVYAPAFVFMCVCLFFVSGASDWTLWLLSGLAIATRRSRARKPITSLPGKALV